MAFATNKMMTDDGLKTIRSTMLLALIMSTTLLEYSLSMF